MIITRTESENGELVLRESSNGLEIIVDGQFLMSSSSGPSSVALIDLGLARLSGRRESRVLIAGLGLGFSLQTALAHSFVRQVTVVELEAALISWHERGLIPYTAGSIARRDGRIRMIHRDFVAYLAECRHQFDLIAVDIDNGPDWLSHPANERLYSGATLAILKELLRPGGVLTIWSADASSSLDCNLRQVFGNVAVETVFDHDGAGKRIEAFIYICQR